jgi:hypothetical protein
MLSPDPPPNIRSEKSAKVPERSLEVLEASALLHRERDAIGLTAVFSVKGLGWNTRKPAHKNNFLRASRGFTRSHQNQGSLLLLTFKPLPQGWRGQERACSSARNES